MATLSDTRKTTPMMAQWEQCKKQAGTAILLFRMGDFYEAFYEDAECLCKELDLTLTKRGDVPMGGVPAQSVEGYIDRMVAKGYRVAVAEQMEDPSKVKGLVKREVVRLLSPGTLIDSSLLGEKDLNLFVSISQVGKSFGIAFLDLSCSHFQVTEVEGMDALEGELFKNSPKEILVPEGFWNRHRERLIRWKEALGCLIHTFNDWHFDQPESFERLRRHFGVYTLDGFGLQGKNGAIEATGGLLAYFQEELSQSLKAIKKLGFYRPQGFLEIDRATEKHLELFEGKSSFFSLLDRTETPMGGRLLKDWLKRPLHDVSAIYERQKSLEILLDKACQLLELPQKLEKIRDIERLVVKVATGLASPRDLLALAHSLKALPPLKRHLESFSLSPCLLDTAIHSLKPLDDLAAMLLDTISDPPPAKLQDGGVIRKGVHAELDNFRSLAENVQEHLMHYQQQMRDETGIKTLKVGFNRMSGYYIEVSRGQSDKVPPAFERRQTLSNGERFVTPELKTFEAKVFASEERIREIEKTVYYDLISRLNPHLDILFENGRWVATIDALVSLALVSYRGSYSKPIVDESLVLKIEGGRHPVIESLAMDAPFVPNDTHLNGKDARMKIITGPNMAGKSTYIRQVALIVILAQMGGYVPAKFAHVGLVDRLFTRIGASDDLSRGQSTFMVEMSETAYILNHTTPKSLVILDEIGRGTSTFDGISIAWAVAEYLLNETGKQAKTLFATHYFELTELEKFHDGVKNYHSAVQESGSGILFLRKIVEGACDRSYGIHVAKLAGLPAVVISQAFEVLKRLEAQTQERPKKTLRPVGHEQLFLF
jgi:DNA mismatch repair protein MutS